MSKVSVSKELYAGAAEIKTVQVAIGAIVGPSMNHERQHKQAAQGRLYCTSYCAYVVDASIGQVINIEPP
jgi:hypothetical protein